MRFGCATGIDNLDLLAKTGYDYIELTLTSIAECSEYEYKQMKQRIEDSSVKVETFNLMLPGSIKVTGADVDIAQQEFYMAKAFRRASEMGAALLVFGSGGARRVPDGFDYGEAYRQLIDFLKRAAWYANRFGLLLAIEPLRQAECNILTGYTEAVALSAAVDSERVKVLVDLFHLIEAGSDPSELLRSPKSLAHVHIAAPHTRTYPKRTDAYDYTAFYQILRKCNYDSRMTIEGGSENLESDLLESMELFRQLSAGAAD